MNIGIIGAGAITQFLLAEINNGDLKKLQVTSLYVRNKKKYDHLSTTYDVQLFDDIYEFLESSIDIVVEAATVEAVQTLIPTVLEKKDVVLISIGALSEETFLREIYDVAETNDRTISLPSGAIGGLDLLQSAHGLGEVNAVSLTTRKPASSFLMDDIEKEAVIFKGSAQEAIKKFPKNINVSIILSLAGLGVEETVVKMIADPNINENNHTIHITGAFGSATMSVTNSPMKTNPNTSYLAALSILSTLKNYSSRIKIG